jgi:glutamate 5-kinase
MIENNTTIIKIGTESIISNLEIQDEFIQNIAYHTAEEIAKKRLIVIASSGAVGIGKEILLNNGKQIEGKTKQQLAGIGNVKLMRIWEEAFAKYGIITSQVLLNSYTVLNGNYYKHIIENAKDGILSVVNANDTLIYSQIKPL